MGLSADAELIWGIPVEAYDDDGEPTVYWDEPSEDWREFEGEIEVRQYGHYEDPDGPKGILTSTRVEPILAFDYEAQAVDPGGLATEVNNDKLYSKSEDQARVNKLPVSFYGEARWWLVASYG